MATRIRLARGGRKKAPFYRIVVADGRAPRDGKYIERIGSYNPLLEENKVILDMDRARHWLDVGAQPSERVAKLFTLQGLQHKMVVIPDYPPPPKKEEKKTEAPKAEAPKEAAKPEEKAAEPKAEAPKEAAKPEEVAAEPKAEAPKEAAPVAEAPKEAAKPEEKAEKPASEGGE